jgi:hypothetical protein
MRFRGANSISTFSFAARSQIGIGIGDVAGEVTRAFMGRAQNLAGRSVGAAPGIHWAGVAVMLARPVTDQVVFRHTGPRRLEPPRVVLEDLSGGAAIGVAGMVVGEVLAREGAVGALGFVEHRDVRLDPALMDQPVQHLGRAIAGVGNQALRVIARGTRERARSWIWRQSPRPGVPPSRVRHRR